MCNGFHHAIKTLTRVEGRKLDRILFNFVQRRLKLNFERFKNNIYIYHMLTYIGFPWSGNRHAGDLGNIEADADGVANVD